MRHVASPSIRLAPVLSVLLVPACFSLPKADVSTHVIEDFAEDAGLRQPTWNAFGPWTCDAFTIRYQDNGDAGPDGGPLLDAGQPPGQDGGPPVTCTLGPGDTKPKLALAATFDLAPSTSNLGVAVATYTMLGPVDFTGFKYFQFSARLTLNMPSTPSPGTTLEVELGCPTATMDVVASVQNTGVTVNNAAGWSLVKLNLTLTPTKFVVIPSSESLATCLRAVDRIRFIVALPADPSLIVGKLELDGIELTNND